MITSSSKYIDGVVIEACLLLHDIFFSPKFPRFAGEVD